MSSPYWALLARPAARRLALACLVGWLSFAMVGFSLLLVVHEATGSFGAAGTSVGLFSIGAGALAPLRGRLVDRFGAARALLPLAAGYSGALLVLAALAEPGRPLAVLAALAAMAGLSAPPLIATARATWPLVTDTGSLRPAYAVQTALGDLALVVGAPVASGLTSAASARVAVAACAAFGGAAAALLVSAPAEVRAPRRPRMEIGLGALRAAGMQTLVSTGAALGLALGALEVALPAFAERVGQATDAAVPFAAFAAAAPGRVSGSARAVGPAQPRTAI